MWEATALGIFIEFDQENKYLRKTSENYHQITLGTEITDNKDCHGVLKFRCVLHCHLAT